jgi:activating signal cointegrator complex subunit 1
MPPKRPHPTHFLAIPLVTALSRPQLTASLARFAADVANSSACEAANVHAAFLLSAIRPVTTLHLTLGVMHLPNQARVTAASEFLKALDLASLLREAAERAREGVDPQSEKTPNTAASRDAKADGLERSPVGVTPTDSTSGAHRLPPFSRDQLPEASISPSAEGVRGGERLAGAFSDGNTSIPGSETIPISPLPLVKARESTSRSSAHDTDTDDGLKRTINSMQPPAGTPNSSSVLICLRGLHSMHAAHSTSILYAAPHDSSGRLYPFCLSVRQAFGDAGFMIEEDRGLKLHATTLNTLYAREKRRESSMSTEKGSEAIVGEDDEDAGGGADSTVKQKDERGKEEETAQDGDRHAAAGGLSKKQGWRKRARAPRIDARALMEKWKDEAWGVVELERLVICEMGAKEDSSGEIRYKEVVEAIVPVP